MAEAPPEGPSGPDAPPGGHDGPATGDAVSLEPQGASGGGGGGGGEVDGGAPPNQPGWGPPPGFQMQGQMPPGQMQGAAGFQPAMPGPGGPQGMMSMMQPPGPDGFLPGGRLISRQPFIVPRTDAPSLPARSRRRRPRRCPSAARSTKLRTLPPHVNYADPRPVCAAL